ncbi:MAG: hypothetical protein ACRDON_07965 [Gaiellaceae bacterium]
MRAKLTSAAVLAATLALLGGAAEARAALPGQNGLIAIDDDRDGDHDIYVVRPSGRLVAKLTRNRANDFSPVWSPSGRRIAFVSDRDGDEEIYVMRADCTNVRQVTRNTGIADNAPAWSPDGTRIVFTSARSGGLDLYIARPDGTPVRRLTRNPAIDATPSWSPDGRWIAFASHRLGEGNAELFKIRPNRTGLTRLTFNEGGFDVTNDDAEPSWSPDGKRIYYINNHAGTTDVYVLDADGGDITQLTDTPLFDESFPRLSPNGRRLLYASLSFDVPWTIRIADADGTEPAALRRGFFADWQRVIG